MSTISHQEPRAYTRLEIAIMSILMAFVLACAAAAVYFDLGLGIKPIPEERAGYGVATVVKLYGEDKLKVVIDLNGTYINTVISTYRMCGHVAGDKFTVKYDTGNIKNYKFLVDRPIFLQTEQTDTIWVKLSYKESISKSKKSYAPFFLSFVLNYRGVEYERCQLIPAEQRALFEQAQVGQMFLATYWKPNAYRMLIDLSQPRK